MVQIPARYEPFTIGRHPYVTEMQFVEPYVYAFGFAQSTAPSEALEIVTGTGGSWEFAEPRFVASLQQDRSEYRFVHIDGDVGLTPEYLGTIIGDDGPIRYIVPIYTSDEPGIPPYTLVPNHVVVTSADLSIADFADLDPIASEQDFFPLVYRDASSGGWSRRIYSSLVEVPVFAPPEEFVDYRGEPGPALLLIEEMIAEIASTNFFAEPDWYVDHPDDLGTPATASHGEADDGYELEA